MPLARSMTWLVGALVALVTLDAHAEGVKAQCVQANTDAQSLRRDGKLNAAREQLRFCSQSKCPGLVVADCVKRLDELENAQPSVVFDVVDGSGNEVNDVTVAIDGHQLVDKLTGAAVEVDLGQHELTFTAAGHAPVRQSFVFREGEKGRRLRVALEPEAAAAPNAAAPPVAATEAPAEHGPAAVDVGPVAPAGARSGSSVKTIGYIVGGAGVATLAVGGVFGYLAVQAKQRQTDNCASASACPHYATAASAHHDGQTDGAIATVAVIAGAAATATGLVLVLTAKHPTESASSASVGIAPQVGPGQAGVALLGSF